MVLKITGGLLIIAASTVIGYACSREYAKRPGQLRELQSQLQLLESELKFLNSPLPEAFRRIAVSGSTTSAFFSSAAHLLENSRVNSAGSAWELAVKENIGTTFLNREDQEIITAFGEMLGNSDMDGQLRNINMTRSRLELQERKAEECRKKNESMYRNLGILGGLALVIFLF